MRKILVSIIAASLILASVFAFSACSIVNTADGVDIVLGASLDASAAGASTTEDVVFTPTALYEVPSDKIPVIDVPDANAATAGLRFAINDDMTAAIVLSYSAFGFPLTEDEEIPTLSSDVYIPYTYEGLPVIGIAPGAFGSTVVSTVTLPKTLMFISEKAFRGSELSTIDIPASVLYIAQDAFIECNKLASVSVDEANERYTVNGNFLMDGTTLVRGVGNGIIGADVTEIAPFAFKGCDAITELTVPATVTKIGNGAFAQCPNLATAVIESQIDKLPDNIFDGCTALTSLSFPESVKTIGYGACRGTGFTELNLPANVETIESSAFENCVNIAAINFSEGLETIGFSAFRGCIRIADLVFPEGLYFIGGSAFRDCSSLASVKISNTVITIGSAAFYNCGPLTSVFIPKSVTVAGSYLFYAADKNFTVNFELSYVPAKWDDNWSVRNVENALESGKAAVAVEKVKIVNSVTPPTN